jgi:F0F1-type ATP synthase membrane subunit b/b'
MKHGILVFVVMGFIAGTLLKGCQKPAESKVENAKENVGTAKDELKDAQAEYQAEWQKFKTESQQAIESNEKQIDGFKVKMEKAGSKARAKYDRNIATLERKNRDLKKKLEEYKDEGHEKWNTFKTDFNREMDEIAATMKDLFKDKD